MPPLTPILSLLILLLILIISTLVLSRRYQSRRTLMRRVRELEELSEAGRAIVAAQLDLDALSQLIVHEADKIIDTRTFQLGFFEGDFFQRKVWNVGGVSQEPQSFDLREGGGLVSWVRDNKTFLLIRDLQNELEELPTTPRYSGGSVPRSAIFIPLISGDEVLGVLGAHSDVPYHFDETHVRQLTIVANQAAAAVANGRLLMQERQRAAQIALIAAITQQINAADNLEEVFKRVVYLTRETFGFFEVNIFYLEPSDKTLYLRASSNETLTQYDIKFTQNDSLVGSATLSGKTIIANDARRDERFVSAVGIPPVDESWTQVNSVFVTPLIVDDVCWGVLEVLDTPRDRFVPSETEVLETLAAGVAIAIQKAQQMLRQRVQAWLTTARLQVANAISESQGLEQVLNHVTRATVLLVGVESVGVLLWEPEREQYVPGELYGSVSDEVMAAFHTRPLKIGQWRALDAVHVSREPYLSTRPWPWLNKQTPNETQTQPATWLWPLLFDQRLLGVLFITQPPNEQETAMPLSTTPDGRTLFPELRARRAELLTDIAHQLGQVLERIRLRRAQEEEAWVNTALLQVAEAVNSLLDLNEILSTIVRFVPMLVGVESCLVLIWHAGEDLFELGPSYGLSEMGLGLLDTLHLDRAELYGYLRQQAKLGAEHYTDAPHYVVDLPPWLGQVLEAAAAQAVPLRAQGRFVGMMLVGFQPDEVSFDGRRLNILIGAAQQAATAVVNNQLYAEAAERDRLEQEIAVAYNIQASLIPHGQPPIPNCEVASLWQAARQVSGDFYDFIPLRSGEWAILIADVADKGVPAALFMAVSRTILRAAANSRRNPGQILRRANELILSDSDSDLFVTVFIAIWDPLSCQIRYACGGHNPPLLVRRTGEIESLWVSGMALGVVEKAEYDTAVVQLEPDDLVLFYTDGVTDAVNEGYDEFGLARLKLLLASIHKHTAVEIVQNIHDDVLDHAGDRNQFDDLTMVVMKVKRV